MEDRGETTARSNDVKITFVSLRVQKGASLFLRFLLAVKFHADSLGLSPRSQSTVPWPAAAASSGDLWEMHILLPEPTPVESETLGARHSSNEILSFNKPSRGFQCVQNFASPSVEDSPWDWGRGGLRFHSALQVSESV